jgi:hypothetical protein
MNFWNHYFELENEPVKESDGFDSFPPSRKVQPDIRLKNAEADIKQRMADDELAIFMSHNHLKTEHMQNEQIKLTGFQPDELITKASDIDQPTILTESVEPTEMYKYLRPEGEIAKIVTNLPLASLEEIEQASPDVTPENKQWVLLSLGFQQRGRAHWYHPFIYQDTAEYWIQFDVYTDELYKITTRLYKLGFRNATTTIQEQIKSIFE